MDMKRFAVNCSIIFTELPLLERPAAAAAAGFSAVEFWWPFAVADPEQADVDAFVTALRDSGVALIGLNLFAGDMAGGDRGILSHPLREVDFESNIKWVRYIALQTGCRAFNALYGLRLESEDPNVQDATARRRLGELAGLTEELGAVILLEPLSGLDRYPLQSARQAIDVIEELHRSGATTTVKVLLDVFHLAQCGDDVSADIVDFPSHIGHVQVADAPGRHEPGTGQLPITRWLDELTNVGYSGYVAFEYVATSPASPRFDWIDSLASQG